MQTGLSTASLDATPQNYGYFKHNSPDYPIKFKLGAMDNQILIDLW